MQSGLWGQRRLGRGQWQPQSRRRSTRYLRVPLCTTAHTSRCTVPRRMSCTLARPPVTTGQSCPPQPLQLCTAQVGTIRRTVLVWSALHLRSRRGLYVEFGDGLEHYDRCRLHLRLSLLLSVVGAVGLLRGLLLGA